MAVFTVVASPCSPCILPFGHARMASASRRSSIAKIDCAFYLRVFFLA